MLIWHVISFCHTRRSQMIPDSFFTCSAGFIFHTGDISRDCAPRVSHMISYGIAHTWNVGEFSVNIVFVSEALTLNVHPFCSCSILHPAVRWELLHFLLAQAFSSSPMSFLAQRSLIPLGRVRFQTSPFIVLSDHTANSDVLTSWDGPRRYRGQKDVRRKCFRAQTCSVSALPVPSYGFINFSC